MEMSKARLAAELDRQKAQDALLKLSASAKQDFAAAAAAAKTHEETDRILRGQLSKEVEKRKRVEEELAHAEQALGRERETQVSQSTDADLVRGQLEDSKKQLTEHQRKLEEKERARQRRSQNFHEEQKSRLELEREVDEVRLELDEFQEKYREEVATLESSLIVEKEKVALASAAQDHTSRDLAREREANASLAECNTFVKRENLCLSKTIEELQRQLRTSLQAVQILEQRQQVDATKAERQQQVTAEQLEILKAASYQATVILTQTQTAAVTEKKARTDVEGKLANEQKFKSLLEDQLRLQKTEVIPLLQHHAAESQIRAERLEKDMKTLEVDKENLQRELVAERKLRIEASEALVNEMEHNNGLKGLLAQEHKVHEGELKKEKTARRALENGKQPPSNSTCMSSPQLIFLFSRSLFPVGCQQDLLGSSPGGCLICVSTDKSSSSYFFFITIHCFST